MQHTFDPYDFSGMSDGDIYDAILEHLGEYPELDLGWIEVAVSGGRVSLGGSVGTDAEAQIAEKALVEVMGFTDVVNNLVVNELHRGEASESAGEALAREMDADDALGGPDLAHQSDTADHLVEDLESQTYGTHDVGTAIEDGASYSPPTRPVADGYSSREDH